jgi:hypothetical protein
MAKAWNLTGQQVRIYCRNGRIPGAVMQNGTWMVPENAVRPDRKERSAPKIQELQPTAQMLARQMTTRSFHGIYVFVQINLAYRSGRLASVRLTRQCTSDVYKKGNVIVGLEPLKVSDLIETLNHFSTFEYLLKRINEPLTDRLIQEVHFRLTQGTVDAQKQRVNPGEYRTAESKQTWRPKLSAGEIRNSLKQLIADYEALPTKERREILDFHVRFERLAPFDDYNGRVGRLIMFKECLRHDVMPFIIDDKRRTDYLEGIRQWDQDRSILTDIVLDCQARFEAQIELQNLREYGEMYDPIHVEEAETYEDD